MASIVGEVMITSGPKCYIWLYDNEYWLQSTLATFMNPVKLVLHWLCDVECYKLRSRWISFACNSMTPKCLWKIKSWLLVDTNWNVNLYCFQLYCQMELALTWFNIGVTYSILGYDRVIPVLQWSLDLCEKVAQNVVACWLSLVTEISYRL